MAIKHSTVHAPNEIVASADWNANHTFLQTDINHNLITNTHNLTTDIDHNLLTNYAANRHFLEGEISHLNILNIGANTHAQIDTKITEYNAHDHSAADPTQVSHANLTNVTADQHHARQHALNSAADHTGTITDAQHGVRTLVNAHAHGNLSGIGVNDHHAQAHTLASHSTKAHTELTNVTANQHHAQVHNMASHSDDYSPGEGIDISAGNVISGENATTVNKGIASFNTNDFSVVAGAVSLKNKTSYWSCPGCAFMCITPATDDIYIDADNGVFIVLSGTNVGASGPVALPNGAVVTSVTVKGDGTWNWYLFRDTLKSTGAPVTMASGTRDSTDNTIASATINNQTYKYWFEIFPLDTDEIVDGAGITYTTDYI